MKYKDQLILTGKINDVGAYTRINIPNSYRAGIELQGKYIFTKYLNVDANIAFSKNKIKNFTEYVDDYDNGGQVTNFYKSTDISFSPNTVAGGSINIIPVKKAAIIVAIYKIPPASFPTFAFNTILSLHSINTPSKINGTSGNEK